MAENKASIVNQLLALRSKSGKSFTKIAEETGLTNVYVSQLFRRQAQLKPETASKLRAAVPELSEELVEIMMRPPMRSYSPTIIQEPTIYRLNEAIMHFGESIKDIINEELGDGMFVQPYLHPMVGGLPQTTNLWAHVNAQRMMEIKERELAVMMEKNAREDEDRLNYTDTSKFTPSMLAYHQERCNELAEARKAQNNAQG